MKSLDQIVDYFKALGVEVEKVYKEAPEEETR